MIIKVLSDSHLNRSDSAGILSGIKDKFDVEVMRTSLSPQLSRLHQEGILRREGMIWVLADEPEKNKAPDASTSSASKVTGEETTSPNFNRKRDLSVFG